MKTQTPNLCSAELCSGCASCRNACPRDAIAMSSDAEGFLAPVVDAGKCVGCKLCEKACPILNPPKLERVDAPKVYACWNNNAAIRFESSSGGMFSVYAERILSEGGVVFGAVYDESMKVVLAKAETSEELARFRSSKYVQAEVGAIYRDVKRELKSGRPVLFVGTPCQVGGLYGYLGTDYDNLYTCDLICHGAPSPVLYEKWLRFLEDQLGGKVVSLNMRGKQGKWSHLVVVVVDLRPNEPFVFQWEKDALVGYVGRMFMKNICLRSSCAQCAFAKFPRVGDVTLGDFWGIGSNVPFDRSIDGGISLNIVNSEKGARLVERSRQDAEWVERSLEEAKAGNPCLYSSSKPHPLRSDFLRDVQTLSYRALARKYRKTLEGTFFNKTRRGIRSVVSRIARFFLSPKNRENLKKILKRGVR